jgi:hypothetical protein
VPEGEPGRVIIGGRAFELGAVYAPRRPRPDMRLRRLVAFEPAAGWNGGKVTVEVVGRPVRAGQPEPMSGLWWSRWAGERVAEVSEHVAEAAE